MKTRRPAMSKKLYMVVEHFKNKDAAPVVPALS